MRVMIDTNILISALLFPNERMNRLIHKITTEYQLVLSSYIVEELLNVIERKFKDKVAVVDILLSQIPYEFLVVLSPPRPVPRRLVKNSVTSGLRVELSEKVSGSSNPIGGRPANLQRRMRSKQRWGETDVGVSSNSKRR